MILFIGDWHPACLKNCEKEIPLQKQEEENTATISGFQMNMEIRHSMSISQM